MNLLIPTNAVEGWKRTLLVIFYLTAASIPLYSQGYDMGMKPKKLNEKVDEWVKGEIIFKNGEIVQREFSYNPLVFEGLLKIKEGDRIITSTAFAVESFSYFDTEESVKHEYISLPVNESNWIFTQILYENWAFSILGRESAAITKHRYDFGTYTEVTTPYKNYIVDMKTRKASELSPSKLMELMSDRENEIKKFIKANKIKFKSVDNYITVVKEYERLTL